MQSCTRWHSQICYGIKGIWCMFHSWAFTVILAGWILVSETGATSFKTFNNSGMLEVLLSCIYVVLLELLKLFRTEILWEAIKVFLLLRQTYEVAELFFTHDYSYQSFGSAIFSDVHILKQSMFYSVQSSQVDTILCKVDTLIHHLLPYHSLNLEAA